MSNADFYTFVKKKTFEVRLCCTNSMRPALNYLVVLGVDVELTDLLGRLIEVVCDSLELLSDVASVFCVFGGLHEL